MKKVLKINACIIMLFSSLLIFFNYKNNDTLHWSKWGESFNSQKVYLKNTNIAGSDLYTLLTRIAQETNVNLVKADYLNVEGKETIIKSVYLGNSEDSLLESKDLIQGEFLTQGDNQSNTFLSTKEHNDPLYKGRLFDFLNDDHVEIWTLHRLMNERENLDGEYIVRSNNKQSIQSFIEKLADQIGITKEVLTKQTTYVNVEPSPIEIISIVGIGISFLIFALLCIFYAVQCSKKIGVMKLSGIKTLHIWKSLIASIIGVMFLFTLILDIFYAWLLENNTQDFMFQLIKMELLMFLCILMASLLIYWIIRKHTISNLIKNKQPVRHLLTLAYGVKCLVIFVLVFLSIGIGAGWKLANDEYEKMKHWEEVGHWGVLIHMNEGDDAASIRQGATTLDKDFASFYSYLNEQGAIYASVAKLQPHIQFKTKYDEQTGSHGYADYFNSALVPANYTLTTFNINPNYLKEYPILDLKGERIQVEESEQRVLLIPESRKEEVAIIEEVYKTKYIASLKSVENRHGIYNDEIPNVQIRSIFYKEDPKGYFAFSSDYANQNYVVQGPIFEVLTEENMALWEKSMIQEQGIHSPLKVNLQNKTSQEFNAELPSITAKYHLDDNQLKYMSIGDIFANDIYQMKELCKQYSIGLLVVCMVMIFITGYLSKLFIQAKKQKYCVQRLYGYSFFDRYRVLLFKHIVITLIVMIIAAILSPQIMQLEYSVISMLIIFLLLCLDILILSISIKRYERKSISQIVKGE